MSQWELDCVERLMKDDQVELLFALIEPPIESGTRLERKSSYLYRKLIRRLHDKCGSMRRKGIREALPDVPVFEWEEINDLYLRRHIRDGLDVVLAFGAAERSEKKLNPAHGTWRFVFGDNEAWSGTDSLVANLLEDRDTVRVTLARRNPEKELVPLKQGVFSTRLFSLANHLGQLNRFCVEWPAMACRDLPLGRENSGRSLSGAERWTPSDSPLRVSALQAFRLWGRLFRDKARRGFERWFVTEHWNVGIADRPIESFLKEPDLPAVSWMPRNDNFMADPFGVQVNGRLYLLMEEFDYAKDKGVITVVRREEDGSFGPGDTVIDLPVHMSYPYLLEHEGGIYCIPETYQAGEVALYRAASFPDKWEKVGVLIENFQAVDATIFRHDGLWWLFCTDENTGWNSHLYIWFSSELTAGWQPHPMNPVKMDVRSARPAGTPFFHQGRLYRPAQDCSRTYGGAVVLNRIDVLTTTEFQEEPVATLAPRPDSPYRDGVHTLSAVGNRTLVDSKRISVNWKVFWIRLTSAVQAKLPL